MLKVFKMIGVILFDRAQIIYIDKFHGMIIEE